MTLHDHNFFLIGQHIKIIFTRPNFSRPSSSSWLVTTTSPTVINIPNLLDTLFPRFGFSVSLALSVSFLRAVSFEFYFFAVRLDFFRMFNFLAPVTRVSELEYCLIKFCQSVLFKGMICLCLLLRFLYFIYINLNPVWFNEFPIPIRTIFIL